MEKFGIDNLKKLICFPLELGNIAGSILADDTSGWKKWLQMIYVIPDGLELLKIDWVKLKDEYNDLSDEERSEIRFMMIEKFDIPNDKVEGMIEASFAILFNIESCIREAVKLFKSK